MISNFVLLFLLNNIYEVDDKKAYFLCFIDGRVDEYFLLSLLYFIKWALSPHPDIETIIINTISPSTLTPTITSIKLYQYITLDHFLSLSSWNYRDNHQDQGCTICSKKYKINSQAVWSSCMDSKLKDRWVVEWSRWLIVPFNFGSISTILWNNTSKIEAKEESSSPIIKFGTLCKLYSKLSI